MRPWTVFEYGEPEYVTRARREAYRRRRERIMMARASIWTLLGLTLALWGAALLGVIP